MRIILFLLYLAALLSMNIIVIGAVMAVHAIIIAIRQRG